MHPVRIEQIEEFNIQVNELISQFVTGSYLPLTGGYMNHNTSILFNSSQTSSSIFGTAQANQTHGYGSWLGQNLSINSSGNFIQPRGNLTSLGFSVNYHKGFSFNIGSANGTDNGTITLTEVANISNVGLFSGSGFKKDSGTNTKILLDGGGDKLISDFMLSTHIANSITNTNINNWNTAFTTRISNFTNSHVSDGIRLRISTATTTLDTTFSGIKVLDVRSNSVYGNTDGSTGLPSSSTVPSNQVTPLFHYGWGGSTWGSSLIVRGWNSGYQSWMISGSANQSTSDEYDFYLRTSGANGTWNPAQKIWTSKSLTDLNQLTNSPGYLTASALPNPSLITSTSATGTSNVATTNTNTYLNIVYNGGSIGSSSQITGSGSVTVTSDAAGKITIAGTNTTYGVETLANLNTGTSTTGLLQSAKNLNDWLNGKGYATTSQLSGYIPTSHVVNAITSTNISNWNTAFTNSHTHSNKSVLDGITSTLVTNWNTVTGKEDRWASSSRDFADGTLITTNIGYSVANGNEFLLEIKGNTYGSNLPADIKVQGYIYNSTIINTTGYTTYDQLNKITALNNGGFLCFWFPRIAYWQGFFARISVNDYSHLKVTSITNSIDPVGTKRVEINLQVIATRTWVTSNFISNTHAVNAITQTNINNWNSASTNNHTHTNKAVLDGITAGLVTNWNTAHTYSQVGHLPLAGGTMTGDIILPTNTAANGFVRDMSGNSGNWSRRFLRIGNTNGNSEQIGSALGVYGTPQTIDYWYFGNAYDDSTLKITTDGKIGVNMPGIFTPSANLDVNGTIRFRNYNSGLLKADASGNLSIDNTNYLPLTGGVIYGHTRFSRGVELATIPVSGAAISNHYLSIGINPNHGMQFGVLTTGQGYIQQTRTDGTATNYSLNLNPNGGQVVIGSGGLLLSNLVGSGNRMVVASSTGVLSTQAIPIIPSAQVLSLGTGAGQLVLSGGGSVKLADLKPAYRADGNARYKTEHIFTPYYTGGGDANYPHTTNPGAGIRIERFSSASSQLGFDVHKVSGQDYLWYKTFDSSATENSWKIIADRDWVASLGYVPYTGATSNLNLGLNGLISTGIVTRDYFGTASVTTTKHNVSMGNNRWLIIKLKNKIYSTNVRANIKINVRENSSNLLPGIIDISLRYGNDLKALVTDVNFNEITYYEDIDVGYISVKMRTGWCYADVEILNSNNLFDSFILSNVTPDLTDKTNIVNSPIEVYALKSDIVTYTGSSGITKSGNDFRPVYGTAANTVAQGNDSRINNGQTAFGWGNFRDFGLGTLVPPLGWALDNLTTGFITGNDHGASQVSGNLYGIHLARSSTYAVQFGIRDKKFLFRSRENSVDTPWMELYHSGNLPVGNLVTATSATGTANVVTTNTNTFLNFVQNGNVNGNSVQVQGAGSVTVTSDTTGKLTITGTNTTYSLGTITELNTGTVSTGRIWGADVLNSWGNSKYFKTQVGASSDMNLEYRNGTGYWINTTTNTPIANDYGTWMNIVSMSGDHNNTNNWINQLMFPTTGTRIFFRKKVNAGAWQSTVELWHSGNLTNVSQLTNDANYLTLSGLPNPSLITSTSATGTSNVATTNTNTYLNIVYNGGSIGSSSQITGSGSVTVTSDAAGKITIAGTNTTYGVETLANLNTGTSTTGLLQSAKNLNDWLTGKGYATTSQLSGYIPTSHAANGITSANITNWNSAFGWGNHASVGYLTAATAPVNSLVTSTSTTGVTNVATTNTNTYLNIVRNGTSTGSSTQVTGAGSVTVSSDVNGKLTITGTNTTYSIITQAEAINTSSTTARLISGSMLGLFTRNAKTNYQNSVSSRDERTANNLVNTYYSSGIYFDFKNTSAISFPATSSYVALSTFAPYGDNTGNNGSAYQLGHSGGVLAYRSWSTSFSSWKILADRDWVLNNVSSIFSLTSQNGIITNNWNSYATGLNSFAIGKNTIASSKWSGVIGTNVSTIGSSSIVIGANSVNNGTLSNIIGSYSNNSASKSGLIGLGLNNNQEGYYAVGRYNSLNNNHGMGVSLEKQEVFAIGAGYDELSRQNIITAYQSLEVKFHGRAYYDPVKRQESWFNINNTLVDVQNMRQYVQQYVQQNGGGSGSGSGQSNDTYLNIIEDNFYVNDYGEYNGIGEVGDTTRNYSGEYDSSLSEFVVYVKDDFGSFVKPTYSNAYGSYAVTTDGGLNYVSHGKLRIGYDSGYWRYLINNKILILSVSPDGYSELSWHNSYNINSLRKNNQEKEYVTVYIGSVNLSADGNYIILNVNIQFL